VPTQIAIEASVESIPTLEGGGDPGGPPGDIDYLFEDGVQYMFEDGMNYIFED